MTETETEHQRRLEREARDECYGTVTTGTPWINVAKVEFTIGHGDTWTRDYEEFSGHLIVRMPGDTDPWVCAGDTCHAELEKRWPDATYRSVDDIAAV
jgi:hypothetical protein